MYNVKTLLVALIGIVATVNGAGKLQEEFSWKQVDFAYPDEATRNKAIGSSFIPENNLPLGLDRWNDKLFITVPRWKAGIAATLTYVNLTDSSKSPVLIPYPSWKANTLPVDDASLENDTLISVFRVRVDDCDRLWLMDTCLADIWGSPAVYCKPAIVIFDLKTDTLIRRYELQPTDSTDESFFANVVVDVTKDTCDDAYAYIPDLGGYGVVVYSLAKNESWRIKHNYFHFDPLNGEYKIGGVDFHWTDGIFAMALSPIQENGFRTMYFHALSSTKEFLVSTEVLRNKTYALDESSYYEYKLLGDRGEKSQSSANFLDEKTGILFYTQVQKDGVACWNTKKPFTLENLPLCASNNETLVFPNDLKVDRESNLWVLSDKMPIYLYSSLNPNDINYRIFKGAIKDVVEGTTCA